MRIVFICGGIEPGKDGVGDYTRRLAGELIRMGHQAAILAMSDRETDNQFTGFQKDGNTQVSVVRYPASMLMKERFALAQAWIMEFDPQWLSLQFVPFAWHPKGLKFGLSNWLKKLGKNGKWHIMFHELWVGMAVEESQKLLWWGKIQRLMIRSLIKNLNPKSIHTQNRLYQAYLKKMGFEAGYLPLFGNIPVLKAKIDGTTNNNKKISFVVFGAIHPDAPIADFASEASIYSSKHGVDISLTFVGRSYAPQAYWVDVWKNAGLKVKEIGEQSPAIISKVLSEATIGISATPVAIIEKSGSFAAMRDHGLPVISVAKAWNPRGISDIRIPAGVEIYNQGHFEECITGVQPVMMNSDVTAVATDLTKALLSIT